MNIEQFKKLVDEYNETGVVPEGLKQFKSKYIGQGWIWKSEVEWDEMKDDDICYLSESCYANDEGEVFDYPVQYGWTKHDFINIVGKERAKTLFEDVDWQSPETLADEYDWGCDYWNGRYTVLHEPSKDYYYIWDQVDDEAVGDPDGNTYHYDDYEDALEMCDEMNEEYKESFHYGK